VKPSAARLLELIGAFKGRRVVVLGDLVTDEFVYGDIARISREAPVLILEHRRTVIVPGGGGNAVANLRALGAVPVPVGVVGRDASGTALVEEFRSRGIPVSGIRIDAAHSTPTKSRVLAGGIHTRRQQIVRIDRGEDLGDLSSAAMAALRKRFRTALSRAEGVLIADYGYGAGHPDFLGEIPAVKRAGLTITVDSRWRIDRFRRVTACTPNQEELAQVSGTAAFRNERELRAGGRELLRKTGNRATVVTRGAEGMIVFEKGRDPIPIAPFGTDEVADVTGAGDTVIATFTLALVAGATVFEAAVLANYAAGIVVTKAGTATVSPDEMAIAVRESLT